MTDLDVEVSEFAIYATVASFFLVAIISTLLAARWTTRETKKNIDVSMQSVIREIRQTRREIVGEAKEIVKDADC